MGLFGSYLNATGTTLDPGNLFIVTLPGVTNENLKDDFLVQNDYHVQLFTSGDPDHSWRYNPFDYIYDEAGQISEEDVDILITTIEKAMSISPSVLNPFYAGWDPFYSGRIRALIGACVRYLLEFNSSKEAHSMYYLSRLVKKAAFADKTYGTELGRLFEDARKRNPDAACFRAWDTFCLFGEKEQKEMVCAVIDALCEFEIPEIAKITTSVSKSEITVRPAISFTASNIWDFWGYGGNLDLRRLGDRRTALFINNPKKPKGMLLPLLKYHAKLLLKKKAENVCPDKWMIVDKKEMPIITMIGSEEEADGILKACRHPDKNDLIGVNGIRKYRLADPWPYEDERMHFEFGDRVGTKENIGQFKDVFSGAKVVQGSTSLPYPVLFEPFDKTVIIGRKEEKK